MEEKASPEKTRRSRAYPGYGLAECTEWVRTVQGKLGTGPHDRGSICEALGSSPKSGAAHRKVGALTHFGLLARDAQGYVVTPLADKITTPLSETENLSAVREALYQPPLYKELIEQFVPEGRVPQMLENTLIRRYGIAPGAVRDAARIFRASGEYAGVLDSGGRIIGSPSQDKAEDKPPADKAFGGLLSDPSRWGAEQVAGRALRSTRPEEDELSAGTGQRDGTSPQQAFRLALARNRLVTLTAPGDLTDDEVELLQKQIEVFAFQARLARGTTECEPE